MDEKKIDYRNKWQKQNQERIVVMVDKGQKEKIKERAAKSGAGSLNAYIVSLIEADMNCKLREEKIFVVPQGEFCPQSCKKRSLQIRGAYRNYEDMISAGVPWCARHVTELEWKDKEAGICFKCEKCLNECRKKEQEKN